MRASINLAVIAGDGIGPEIVPEGLKVLRAALAESSTELSVTPYSIGAQRYLDTGETLSTADLEALAGHDALLLGAIGDPRVPAGILEREILLRLRFAFDHYVNLRPSVLYPGVPTPLAEPGNIDLVVVREGTEGLYSGNGGSVHRGMPTEVATEVSVNTAHGTERLVRYAFELAASRPRRHLTLVHKTNVLVHAGGLWQRTVDRLAAEYPNVNVDYCNVDAATIYLVTDPQRFDVIVTDNLFGDILTDEAGAVSGGVGLAASGNINPEGDFPSMFEPIHGSAPDIAGTGKADPTATIASVALMLRHLGLAGPAARIEAAIRADMEARAAAAAAGVPLRRTTAQIGDAILAAMEDNR
ncbi:3-isopropylmalate dehydrogenase [Actinotignum sp. GS-2025b]|uniref:3-isopropylmalate dehydrogenase n=1 Tax=Actinotignum sp. GS-2025b TaxID=3427275 RepID=UPI003F44FA6C